MGQREIADPLRVLGKPRLGKGKSASLGNDAGSRIVPGQNALHSTGGGPAGMRSIGGISSPFCAGFGAGCSR